MTEIRPRMDTQRFSYYLTGQTCEQACLHTLTADVETIDSRPHRKETCSWLWVFDDNWDDVSDEIENRNRHREFGRMKMQRITGE